MPNQVDDELTLRTRLWADVHSGDPENIAPKVLRDAGVYGGAQGIWVDKKRTASLSPDGMGVTVGILHTGRHYPDDLSDDGVIYHLSRHCHVNQNWADLGATL